jgi:hypothetical protein
MIRSTRSKYFKGQEPELTAFEVLCKGRHLKQSEILNVLISQFLKENDRGQTTLQGFPKEPERLPIFERAALVGARSELARILENINRAPPENKRLFQQDLAKALRIIEPTYMRTKDPELQKLLRQAEEVM